MFALFLYQISFFDFNYNDQQTPIVDNSVDNLFLNLVKKAFYSVTLHPNKKTFYEI